MTEITIECFLCRTTIGTEEAQKSLREIAKEAGWFEIEVREIAEEGERYEEHGFICPECAGHIRAGTFARALRCLRCGHVWIARSQKPKTCPQCRSPYWDTPRMR